MDVLKIFQMDEPISNKIFKANNLRISDPSFNSNKSKELERLRKQLLLARSENTTLQGELSASMKEDSENRAKIVKLTTKLKELERKQELYISLEQKVQSLENMNRLLEDKLKIHENDKEIDEEMKYKMKELGEVLGEKQNMSLVIDNIGDASVTNQEMEFQKVMLEYDKFLRKILSERQTLIDEKNIAQQHLANLETGFNDLLQKYERAKKVIVGFKSNEDVLKNQMNESNKMLDVYNKKYNDLKTYTENKILEANTAITNKDKENIEEIAKLKAKILQSQVKISELERHVKPKELDNVSLFAPLKNNLKKKH